MNTTTDLSAGAGTAGSSAACVARNVSKPFPWTSNFPERYQTTLTPSP